MFGRMIDELMELLQADRRLSPRSSAERLDTAVKNLAEELEEMRQAVEVGDVRAAAAELGDVLWVTLFSLLILEEGGIARETWAREVIEKLRRRKPWLMSGHRPSAEEEHRLWNEAKQRENGSDSDST